MPEIVEPAPGADVLSALTELFDDALYMEVSLSKYREKLRPLTVPTSSWLGMIAPTNNSDYPSPARGFVPLARVRSWEPAEGEKTGRLHNLLFLQNSKILYRAAHTSHAAGNGDEPYLIFVTPRALPEGCPIQTDTSDACDNCALWAHCATGRLPFADLRYVKISGFHCMKVCKVDDEWFDAGQSAKRLSYRTLDATPQQGVPLTGVDLRALPQFEPYCY